MMAFFGGESVTHPDSASVSASHQASHEQKSRALRRASVSCLDAAKALLPTLQKYNVPLQEEQYFQLSSSEPSKEVVKGFLAGFLAQVLGFDPKAAEEIQEEVDRAVAAHPVASKIEEKVELDPKVVIITDVVQWQSGLMKSKAPVPVSQDEEVPHVNGIAAKL